jgi:6-phosphogluconolactonase
MKWLRLLLAWAFAAAAVAAPAKEFLVFFGTYTGAVSHGIYVARLDSVTGSLSTPELAAEAASPSFLAIAPGEKFLYAANSVSAIRGGNGGAVSAFAIDKTSGRLRLLNQEPSGGSDPCHLAVDATGRCLLVANYNSGTLKSFRLNPDGTIGAVGSLLQHHGSSVNPSRQTAAHAHFICPDPSNDFALACDLGMDQVVIYRIEPPAGTLAAHASVTLPPGSGPRHLAFSPDGKFARVINEMACTITTFAWDAAAGKLKPVATISALPPGLTARPDFTAAEILAAGNFVYATVRGPDLVTVLAADPSSGHLLFVQSLPAGGKMPRGLGVDPTHRWLFTGNQTTDNVVEFAIDPATGKLAPAGRELKIGSPVDVKFVAAE